MTFDEQNDFEFDKEFFALLQDFEQKARGGVEDMFYDIDDWLDIIDFLVSENIESRLLNIALEKSLYYYPKEIQLKIREAYIVGLSDAQKGYAMLEEIENDADIIDSEENKRIIIYQKAKALISLERYQEAIVLLSSIKGSKINIFIQEQYALALFKQGDIFRATSEVIKLLMYINILSLSEDEIIGFGAGDLLFLDTPLSDTMISLAAELHKSYIKAGGKSEIADRMEEIVCSHPLEISYWEMLAEFYLRAEEHKKAQEAFDYCLSINPLDITIYSRKLETYANDMDKENEYKILRKMMNILENKYQETQEPERKKELVDMGVELLRLFIDSSLIAKQYDECLRVCQTILNMNEHYPFCDGTTFYSKGEIMIFMAECQLGKGNTKKATDLALYAVKTEPEYYGHRIRFAEILYDSGDVSSAEDVFQTLYEHCCEESAKEEFASKEESDNAIYFQKHLYYIVAAWAVKMAKWGKVQQAVSLISSNIPNDINLYDNELFILKCASIEVFSYEENSNQKILELIENIVLVDGISVDAILHRIPRLYEDRDMIEKIKQLKQRINNELR